MLLYGLPGGISLAIKRRVATGKTRSQMFPVSNSITMIVQTESPGTIMGCDPMADGNVMILMFSPLCRQSFTSRQPQDML